MKELDRNEAIGKIYVFPGDHLIATCTQPDGIETEVGRYEITKEMVVDTLVIIEPEPGELGLSGGIGAIFGVRQKDNEVSPAGRFHPKKGSDSK